MKEMNDDELQEWFDGKQPTGESQPQGGNADAYRAVFAALKKDPERGLPYDFSARVMQRVKAGVKRNNDLKWTVLAVLIFAVIVAACYGLILTFSPEVLPSLLAYKWIFLIAPPIFIAIQAIDQKLVKSDIFRT